MKTVYLNVLVLDTCVCIFDENLVKSFKRSQVTDPPRDFLETNFQSQKDIPQIADIHRRMMNEAARARQLSLQKALLVGMVSPNYGQYSIFHENAVYVYGLDDHRALHTAWM